MISQSDRHTLIDASICFMRTVTDVYGAEKGMELWSSIADTIDTDLKAEVFMAMLTGDYRQDKINAKPAFSGASINKVGLIRCIRNYDKRKLGLKEAKDIADRLVSGHQEILEVNPELRPTFIIELHKHNIVV